MGETPKMKQTIKLEKRTRKLLREFREEASLLHKEVSADMGFEPCIHFENWEDERLILSALRDAIRYLQMLREKK